MIALTTVFNKKFTEGQEAVDDIIELYMKAKHITTRLIKLIFIGGAYGTVQMV